MLTFGSVCSGIEAASVAWNPLGWKASWVSEIEPFPSAVLAHHYPDIPNLGDMTKLVPFIDAGIVVAPDVFCGGTPCQAFSVAGLRQSLDDARGNLSLTFCEIADAIDNKRESAGLAPSVIFWENVPGVLSTKDNAFGCFLAGLAGEDNPLEPPRGKWTNAGCVLGPKRAVAWRTLDAQYYALAQQRRRVFVVASARADFDPATVLFEFGGVRRDTAPSRQTGQTATHATAPCLTSSGRGVERTGDTRGQDPVVAVKHPSGPGYRCGCGYEFEESLGAYGCPNCEGDSGPATLLQAYAVGNTLTARMAKGINTTLDEGQTPVIVHGTQDPCVSDIAFAQGRNNGGENVSMQSVVGALACNTGPNGHDAGNFACNQAVSENQRSELRLTDFTYAITSGGGKPGQGYPAALVPAHQYIGGVDCENNAAGGYMALTHSVRLANTSSNGWGVQEDVTHTLDCTAGPAVHHAMQVRRLMPVECERLQGFPDFYTAIPWRKKPASECPDGPRYKALGNSWAVPVVRWIGQRIQKELEKC